MLELCPKWFGPLFFVHLSLITICDVTKGKEVISPAVPLAQGAVAKGISQNYLFATSCFSIMDCTFVLLNGSTHCNYSNVNKDSFRKGSIYGGGGGA